MYDQMGHYKENVMKAFPRPNTIHPDDLGMDLRDYFAAKAMQGIIDSSIDSGLETIQIAKSAYLVADAMMEAKNDKKR